MICAVQQLKRHRRAQRRATHGAPDTTSNG